MILHNDNNEIFKGAKIEIKFGVIQIEDFYKNTTTSFIASSSQYYLEM